MLSHFLCRSEIPLNSSLAFGGVKVQQGEGEGAPHIYEATDITGPGVGVEGDVYVVDEGVYEITD